MTPKSNLNSTAELFKLYKINKLYMLVEVLVTVLLSWIVYMILSELNLNSYLCVGVSILLAVFIMASSFLKRRKKVKKTIDFDNLAKKSPKLVIKKNCEGFRIPEEKFFKIT